MAHLASEITAVTKLAFVADAYPYGNDGTIVVVLKAALRDCLPLSRAVLKFQTANFSVATVVEAYERDVLHFLTETLCKAERLMVKPAPAKSKPLAQLCLN